MRIAEFREGLECSVEGVQVFDDLCEGCVSNDALLWEIESNMAHPLRVVFIEIDEIFE